MEESIPDSGDRKNRVRNTSEDKSTKAKKTENNFNTTINDTKWFFCLFGFGFLVFFFFVLLPHWVWGGLFV